jgi:hypothetical protein
MNIRTSPIPLRADPIAVYDDAMRSLCRAALAIGIHGIERSPGTSAETVLVRRAWDGDRLYDTSELGHGRVGG